MNKFRKAIILFILSTILTSSLYSQGVQFIKNTSWSQILAKAKAENKYIFVGLLCHLVRALQDDGSTNLS